MEILETIIGALVIIICLIAAIWGTIKCIDIPIKYLGSPDNEDKKSSKSVAVTILVCVDNSDYKYLTLGKHYTLVRETLSYYRIENDLGNIIDMVKVRFVKSILK